MAAESPTEARSRPAPRPAVDRLRTYGRSGVIPGAMKSSPFRARHGIAALALALAFMAPRAALADDVAAIERRIAALERPNRRVLRPFGVKDL